MNYRTPKIIEILKTGFKNLGFVSIAEYER